MLRNVLDLAVKIVASATILFFLALAVLVSKEDKREEKLPTNLASAVQIAASDSSPSATLKAQEWAYSHQADDMARGIINEAWIKSQNKFEFSSPYDGRQRATLLLRTHPRFGKDVILSIEKGQFVCRSYNRCTVLVRFDDHDALKYAGAEPGDHSTTAIFISGYDRFLENMRKSRTLRIAADVYQEGQRVFEFDVSGFEMDEFYQRKPSSQRR